MHLLSIETSFISSKLWKDPNLVQKIGEELQNDNHRLINRVIHQAVFQIHFLCKRLGIDEVEDVSFMIFQESLKCE